MIEYINISSAPAREECAQVGTPDYHKIARRECNAFKNQLTRTFGEPPNGAYLKVKSFPHDFGNYLEVVCYFDADISKSEEYALSLERNMPEYWDIEAVKELLITEEKECV